MAVSGFDHSTFCSKYVQLVDVYNSNTMFYVDILDNLSRKP